MRVIAGTAKSIRLTYPRGARIRPTTDAIREALFSSLGDVAGMRFADVYAGCGSVGIEALSRGAEKCVFLEKDERCLRALTRNLLQAGLTRGAQLLAGPAERTWGAAYRDGDFDIIFADPPYGLASFDGLLRRLVVDGEGVAAKGVVVVQCRVGYAPEGIHDPVVTNRYGESELRFYERG